MQQHAKRVKNKLTCGRVQTCFNTRSFVMRFDKLAHISAAKWPESTNRVGKKSLPFLIRFDTIVHLAAEECKVTSWVLKSRQTGLTRLLGTCISKSIRSTPKTAQNEAALKTVCASSAESKDFGTGSASRR